MSKLLSNAAALEQDLAWFGEVVATRLRLHTSILGNPARRVSLSYYRPNTVSPDGICPIPKSLLHFTLRALGAVLALAPQAVRSFWIRSIAAVREPDRRVAEFGGYRAQRRICRRGDAGLPCWAVRIRGPASLSVVFDPQHVFSKHHILAAHLWPPILQPHRRCFCQKICCRYLRRAAASAGLWRQLPSPAYRDQPQLGDVVLPPKARARWTTSVPGSVWPTASSLDWGMAGVAAGAPRAVLRSPGTHDGNRLSPGQGDGAGCLPKWTCRW